MNYPIELMLPTLEEKGIALNREAAERLDKYAALLVEWNEKMNLTAITDPEGIVIKHFLDSALLLSQVNIPQGAKVVDVGTGAGFPGMVLKILRPDLDITLMDGLNKRLTFLNEVARELALDVKTVHLRAEEAGKNPNYREKFDIVTARAVAELRTLYEYCLPL
ncbi:MAG: 16S rRNA (guanine(527)-N(7))-methyltransferase RsmG, partial [Acutalibacteraceae bacterium]|nr:16S rRNA (guanine(527)-N(7))-methyltransferase RsmG [Acutalibacteraceae bacterium]